MQTALFIFLIYFQMRLLPDGNHFEGNWRVPFFVWAFIIKILEINYNQKLSRPLIKLSSLLVLTRIIYLSAFSGK